MPTQAEGGETRLRLTKTRLIAGRWEGQLTQGPGPDDTAPRLVVSHLDQPLDGVALTCTPESGVWQVTIAVPAALISDGVQTFVIADAATGASLDSFTLIAGDALDADIRAEVDLLRAELDLLKRAFRRHCVETA